MPHSTEDFNKKNYSIKNTDSRQTIQCTECLLLLQNSEPKCLLM